MIRFRSIAARLMAAAALLLAPAAHADDGARALIARYIEWRGGERYLAVEAIAREGTLVQTGLEGRIAETVDRDGRHRLDTDLGPVAYGRAVGLDAGWSRNASGQIEDMQPAQVAHARRAARMEFAAGVLDEDAGPRLLGTEALDGRRWSVLRYAHAGDERYDLFIDPASGALHAMRAHDDGREQFVRYDDWRMVDGVRFAFARTTRTTAGSSQANWERVAAAPALEPAALARPGAESRVAFAPGAAGSGWIDFDFFGRTRIFIPARVDGHDTVVLLDSGAEATVLDAAFAASIGLEGSGEVTALGTGGTQQARFLPDLDIELGALRLGGVTGVAIDLADTAAALGHPLPVILGKEIFNETVVEIDFVGRRIAFHDPARFVAPDGFASVPVLTGPAGVREVEVRVEDDAPIRTVFDLGNGGPLVLFPAYWQREGWLLGRRTTRSLGGAVGGLREQSVARVRTLGLGPFALADLPTSLSPGGGTALEGTRTLGNVGLPVFARFHLIVDFPHDRLLLAPNARFDDPFPYNRSGLGVVREADALRVVFVAPGSPAAGAWRVDERIVAVDGQPVERMEDPMAWRERAAGTRVMLTLDDGSTRTLQLADYF